MSEAEKEQDEHRQIVKVISVITAEIDGLQTKVAFAVLCTVLEEIFNLYEGEIRTKVIDVFLKAIEKLKGKEDGSN